MSNPRPMSLVYPPRIIISLLRRNSWGTTNSLVVPQKKPKNGRPRLRLVLNNRNSLDQASRRVKNTRRPLHISRREKVFHDSYNLSELLAAAHAKASEAVTSDEEAGAISGEETKRPSKWTRRISGSLQKITGSASSPSKEQAPEAPKAAEAPKDVTAAAESAAEPAPITSETAPAV